MAMAPLGELVANYCPVSVCRNITDRLCYRSSSTVATQFHFSFHKERANQRAIERSNDHLEILMARAGRETKAVSITLKSRKVYVGLITRTHDPLYDRKYIQLLPIKSGYRAADTLALHLTVDYAAVYAQIIQQDASVVAGGIQGFEIVVPLSEIQSVNLFDPAAYQMFNPPQQITSAEA
jgi:hypothetical protein